ncbi:MAG TPA: orotate phosphoribosyltransferase [Rubricoccaceae bacterium]|nr:orotate phosphoribosyltransferase [Rubricoccaceae bacterium]
MDDLRRALAADLLDVGAVVLRSEAPFTWASGWKAPIYCDNRLTLSEPAVRRRVTDGFAAVVEAYSLGPDVIAGTATAGIPHAAWLADRLSLPLVYVRSKPKEHGRGNQVEGRLGAGQAVVLVEDTVSTGGSSLGAVEALRAAGTEVRAVLALFSYRFEQAERAFAEAGVPLFALTDYDTLLVEAQARGLVSETDLEALRAWRVDPAGWGG